MVDKIRFISRWCEILNLGKATIYSDYRLTQRVPLVEQELLTLSEHLSSPPVFSGVGVRVVRSLVLCVCFVDRCLSFCTFSFGHCVVCSSSIYGFWLPPFGIFKLFFMLRVHRDRDRIVVGFTTNYAISAYHH